MTRTNSALNEGDGTSGSAAPEGADDGLAALIASVRALAAREGGLPAERQLAELLDVKRHQLRRALKALRSTGEIEPPKPRARRGGSGVAIGDLIRNTNPVEVVELRIMIEPTLARLAAVRATPNMIAALRQAVEEIARGDQGGAARYDLHRMIAEASGNGLAAEFYNMLRRIEADARLNANVADGLRPAGDTREHEAIVNAIAARAPEDAEREMRAHLSSIHRLIVLGSEPA